jgi:hypothetical protein
MMLVCSRGLLGSVQVLTQALVVPIFNKIQKWDGLKVFE